MLVSKYSFHIGKTHEMLRISCNKRVTFLICMFFIRLRFPFDWQNPLGYLTAFILICIINLNLMTFMMCILCLGIEVYTLITSFTKDIKYDLNAFNRRARTKLNLSKQLSGLVRFHSTVKRFEKLDANHLTLTPIPTTVASFVVSLNLFSDFLFRLFQRYVCRVARIVQPILMVYYFANILAMCIPMLSIQWAMVKMALHPIIVAA